MAELLVRVTDNLRPGDNDDVAYRPGDVVAVAEDGQQWGREELSPRFRVVKVPGVPKERFHKYLRRGADKRREFYVNLPALPPEGAVAVATHRHAFRNKATDAVDEEL